MSNAEKAVENIKQEKATPQQWLAIIEKNGGEKMDIRIKLNYMDKTGRSLIKVGDSLYLLDHTDREGIANRGKLDGFGVVAKLNVEGLDEEQINYIKQEYYAGRIEGTQREFKNWIERAKYDTRLEDSSRIDAKNRKAN